MYVNQTNIPTLLFLKLELASRFFEISVQRIKLTFPLSRFFLGGIDLKIFWK